MYLTYDLLIKLERAWKRGSSRVLAEGAQQGTSPSNVRDCAVLDSNLKAPNFTIPHYATALIAGISVTGSCISFLAVVLQASDS